MAETNVTILVDDGFIEKKSFVSSDSAESHLLSILVEKDSEGKKALAVLENPTRYVVAHQNSLVILQAEEFFSALGDLSTASKTSGESLVVEKKDFLILKSLLESEDWPQAVFEVQIADENSEKDKEERAQGICDILLPPISGKKILDFGCGEGHIAKHLSNDATLSVGYDIEKSTKSQFEWEQLKNNLLLTTDFEKVKFEGQYDAIVIYDVLDHASQDSMSEILLKAKSVLSDEGKIYLRCHPWCCRHGGHAYRKINKAFVHLVLDQDELKSLGVEIEYGHKVATPLATYGKAIEDAGLVKDSEHEIDTQEVEPFFSENPLVKGRILKAFGIKEWGENGRPSFQMSQCFVDYVLKK